MVEYGPRNLINTTSHISTAQMGVSHEQTVLPAGAFTLQRCNVVLSAYCTLSTWYMSGLCACDGAKKGRFTGTYEQK